MDITAVTDTVETADVAGAVASTDAAAGTVAGAATNAAAADELSLLTRLRRDLHRIPEVDFNLPKTIAYVEGVLKGLSCEVLHPSRSCVCAFFNLAGRDAPATAIRADMDALPVLENTGARFASEHAGRMHACGHDAHMAMALAAALWLNGEAAKSPAAFDRNALFVFQPAEETTGGAKTVCESGVFEGYGVDRIYGFHVWPDLPAGVVASAAGPLLARSSETHVRIHGASTHIAKTYGVADADSHDAALAAARFLIDARALMDRLGKEEPCICKFGLVQAGTVCNAVAGEAHVAGSLRVFSDAMFARAKEELEQVLQVACAAYGCSFDLDFADGYPPVTNDAALFEAARSVFPELEEVGEPLLIAEDFAFYQRRLPGLFMLLGTGVPEGEENPSDAEGCPAYATSALHADDFLFSERVLLKGLDIYKRLLRSGAAPKAP